MLLNMSRYHRVYSVLQCLFYFIIIGQSVAEHENLLNGFIEFLNNLPNQPYVYEDGILLHTQNIHDNLYKIDVSLKVHESEKPQSFKLFKCTASVYDLVNTLVVQENGYECHEDIGEPTNLQEVVTENVLSDETSTVPSDLQEEPVKLDNEVQSDTAATSGEQFVAIPRRSSGTCIGCSSIVDVTAPGVHELSLLGIRHLDRHEPDIVHTLIKIIEVERQVQVVNGVRYTVTLDIGYNNCTSIDSEDCSGNKTCKISILEKPWLKLPDGSKFRAILSNNCTEGWLFGDDGEVLDDNQHHNPQGSNDDNNDEIFRVVQNHEVQAIPNQEKTLTEEEIKNIERQIVPKDGTAQNINNFDNSNDERAHEITVSQSESSGTKIIKETDDYKENLTEDKRKAIDDLMNLFDFVGSDAKSNLEAHTRSRRSYQDDLTMLKMSQKYKTMKRKIENAKYLYTLGESMVDYMNQMDYENKNRELGEILKAEEEFANHQHFFYIQALVLTPCDKSECSKDSSSKICNAVIDASIPHEPQILNNFCYNDMQKKRGALVKRVPLNDKLLKKLSEKALEKIEQETKTERALIIKKIVDATTEKASGRVTKISLEIAESNCSSSVPTALRYKCQPVDNVQLKLCEAIVLERHNSEKSITFSCIERNSDDAIEDKQYKNKLDKKVAEMIQDALQYLESQSENKNKLKIVDIGSISTQFVAGLLTKIVFTVGNTHCKDESSANACQLVKSDSLRKCVATIWDRSWLEDGKKMNVSCNEVTKQSETNRNKRQVAREIIEVNPNDSKYRAFAEESLNKYLQSNGITGSHKILKVEQATRQTVSGIKSRIVFTVSAVGSVDVLQCRSEIWERPWLKSKDIDVQCAPQLRRKKRHISEETLSNTDIHKSKKISDGREVKQNSSDARYTALATKALRQYLKQARIYGEYGVVKVNHVTQQVVAGTLTVLDFTASMKYSNDSFPCFSEAWERPWSEDVTISVHCDHHPRKRREVWTGGQSKQDPNKPEYRALAQDSLREFIAANGVSDEHEVISVNSVTTQVVAGVLIRLNYTASNVDRKTAIDCYTEVWDRPWLNSREFTKNTCDLNKRQKRNIPGSPASRDPKDPKYRSLAEESLVKFAATSGNAGGLKVLSVDSVTVQVVAGTLTKVDYTVSAADGITIFKCHSEVWERPWLKSKEFTKNTCDLNKRQKRNVPGGPASRDPKDPKYRSLAEESLVKFAATSGNAEGLKVMSVDSVTVQVVAGTLTKVDYTVSGSDGVTIFKCHSEVWERPWLKSKEFTENTCEPQKKEKRQSEGGHSERRKRSIFTKISDNSLTKDRRFGAEEDQSPDDTYYLRLAEEALQNYQQSNSLQYIHKVVKVKKVTRKIIAGVLYAIDFEASPTNCLSSDLENAAVNNTVPVCEYQQPYVSLDCQTKFWDRPWLKHGADVDVDCKVSNKDELLGISENFNRKTRSNDDDIDEDTKYYYAEAAVKNLNDFSDSKNLQKLISIHTIDSKFQMNKPLIRMYIEVAYTYCMKHADEDELPTCEEMDGLNHRLCLVRLYPSLEDEFRIENTQVVCDDEEKFKGVTGMSIADMIKGSLKELEKNNDEHYKLVHFGEPYLVPSLNSKEPMKLSFLAGPTNCSKDVDLNKNFIYCYVEHSTIPKACHSLIWLSGKKIRKIKAACRQSQTRTRRSLTMSIQNATADELIIHQLVKDSLDKLEMASSHMYKQRVIQINSYTTKITTGKLTTIDFDVGYTSCLKYEWVENATSCEFLEHLPRRHCVSNIYERLWIENGKHIEVSCEDDESPLEAHIEFESAAMATELANEALKHIEAKYPHSHRLKVVRIFSLEKQQVAGFHYRMKVEVGYTNCMAWSVNTESCYLVANHGVNKFCRINVWVRPWTDQAPHFRVVCDYQETSNTDMYKQIQAEQLFSDFITTYSPSYQDNPDEMERRFHIFKENIQKVQELNIHERGTAKYALTRFSDLTYDEFSNRYLGLNTNLRNPNSVPYPAAKIPHVAIPSAFDWRDHGAVTEVKNQGSCGSCWAFSVTGNIEGQWKLRSGQLVSLSEQELVDCDKLDNGCNGGLPDNAYRAIEQLGGLELENDYPYDGEDEKCSFNRTMAKVQITGAVNITSNETDMAKWLVKNGPISIGINANAMQFYVGGVSHPWKMLCSPKNLDHGVLIVGYGVKDYPLFHKRLPYWIVKNSWGDFWGEQGYYRVYRGDGTCGVNQMASSAVIDKST